MAWRAKLFLRANSHCHDGFFSEQGGDAKLSLHYPHTAASRKYPSFFIMTVSRSTQVLTTSTFGMRWGVSGRRSITKLSSSADIASPIKLRFQGFGRSACPIAGRHFILRGSPAFAHSLCHRAGRGPRSRYRDTRLRGVERKSLFYYISPRVHKNSWYPLHTRCSFFFFFRLTFSAASVATKNTATISLFQ